MFQPNNQISFQPLAISIQESPALMQVDENAKAVVAVDEVQNGAFSHAESIIYSSKKLQDDLQMLGVKIKQHEDNIKFLRIQKNQLDESILDLQVILGKYHSSTPPKIEKEDEDEATEQILRLEKSAAGILCQMKTRHANHASNLTLMNDVLGIVATLGKVDDDNLSRLFSEYLGLETMLGIVCKTYDGAKALETYEKEGCINKMSGVHGLGTSIGRTVEGLFLVICLENLRPYVGDFVPDDPQKKLDLLKPKLPNGECPPGFLGFAVNMINLDTTHLYCLTASGYGLRESLFYSLFSRLQVYSTRADMFRALPCISDGALSLDGGMIKTAGIFSFGNRDDIVVRFSKRPSNSSMPQSYVESERQIRELKWKKDKMLEDMKREQALQDNVKLTFDKKKAEFLKFLAQSSSYATQQQVQAAQGKLTPR